MRVRLLTLLLLATGSAVVTRAGEPDEFRVVVNASNPVETLSRKQVGEIFMKKVIAWPGGETIQAVEPPDRAPVRERFCQAIHGKTSSALRMHWTRVMFSGEDAPPVMRPSDGELLAFVRSMPGGIGYISPAALLGPGVKAIRVTP